MAARGTAAPRDKDQLKMSERKNGGDPSACGRDRGGAHVDPVAPSARPAPAPSSPISPATAPSSADPQFAKTEAATSAGRRRQRVLLLHGGARHRRAKG